VGYELREATVTPDLTYWNWLEEVDVQEITMHPGPLSVQVQTSVGDFQIHLPLVNR
jgi:hypothetical protein